MVMKSLRFSKLSKECGSVMIGALIVSFIILTLLIAFAGAVNYQIRQAAQIRRAIQASYIAEGGIERAKNRLNTNPLWRDGYTNQILGGGTYTVAVVDLGNDYLKLDSTATVGGKSVILSTRLKPIYKLLPPMIYGAYGDNSVALGNGKVYSYDSDVTPTPDPLNPGNDGDVGTRSKSASTVTVSANSQVYGDIVTGAGSDPNVVISAHPDALITGQKMAATEDPSFPKVKIPNNAIPMGDLNSSITLASGIYHFTSINLAGADSLIATGPVKIYVSGPISIGGNGEKHALSYKPEDLRVYATNAVSSISLSGNATFYGLIYAPNASITLNGGGAHGMVAGSIAGKSVTFNGDNTRVYYDVDLRNLSDLLESGDVSKYQVTAMWKG